jgi:hypothetical protein
MTDTSSYHSYIDELLLESSRGDLFFNEQILAEPIKLSDVEMDRRNLAHATISRFFSSSREIFRRCVLSDAQPELRKLLVNDSENAIPNGFYRELPEAAWTDPMFFRTDESREGRIFEIQCPGSGWGDMLLLGSLYRDHCQNPNLALDDPRTGITGAIQNVCKSQEPTVLHLLDNSSNPTSMQYLIRCTQPPLLYWGYHKEVRNSDCSFVRSHSVYGLIAENLFRHRLKLAEKGKVTFDLPPLMVFDQKMILCLPFLDETAAEFSDDIRELLTYTYPVSAKGFRDANGEWVTIKAFLQRQPHDRKYFLKYGGCDTTINWGSRGVYRLDSEKASSFLSQAAKDYAADRPWVIQPDLSNKEKITYFFRDSEQPKTETLTAKYSSFYGPTGLLGVRTHHRRSTKVHGQSDAIVGLAY